MLELFKKHLEKGVRPNFKDYILECGEILRREGDGSYLQETKIRIIRI